MKTRIRTRMKTRACIISRKTPAGAYLGEICRRSKALRNTTNFYIRNTYTGIVKSPEERTHNETEVLHFVFTGIRKYNAHKRVLLSRDVRKAGQAGGAVREGRAGSAISRGPRGGGN